MATAQTSKFVTADELFATPDSRRCELIEGEIVEMAPAGEFHGKIGMRIAWRIAAYVEQSSLGECYMAETGFLISRDPDTVRAPDLAFVPKDHAKPVTTGYCEAVPKLVVEVVSPNDTVSEVTVKTEQWLAFGVSSVWVVEPLTRTVTIYRNKRDLLRFHASDVLEDQVALPGFRLVISDIFKP